MDDKTECGMQKNKLAVYDIRCKDKAGQAVSFNTIKTIRAKITVLSCMAHTNAMWAKLQFLSGWNTTAFQQSIMIVRRIFLLHKHKKKLPFLTTSHYLIIIMPFTRHDYYLIS